MKHIFLFLLFTLTSVLPSHSEDESLTAYELARHLSISSWISKLQLSGEEYFLEITPVKDSKIQNTLLSKTAYPTDRGLTRVVILANRTPKDPLVSIQILGSSTQTVLRTSILDFTSFNLPPILTSGDFVLCGDVPPELTGKDGFVPTIKDFKNGLILRVTKKA